jgi:hypothetical protein
MSRMLAHLRLRPQAALRRGQCCDDRGRERAERARPYRLTTGSQPTMLQRTSVKRAFRGQQSRKNQIRLFFLRPLRAYNPATMCLLRREPARTPDRTSDIEKRVQRLEHQQAELLLRLEGERQLRILAAQIIGAAQVAPLIGGAVEKFAQAKRAPLPRGHAGGLARARSAWRHFDGTFMAESTKLEARVAGYERYAAGGRARAARALRNSDGTFTREIG